MVDQIVDEKPVFADEDEDDFVGTAYKLTEWPMSVSTKDEDGDGFVIMEFEDDYIMWKVKGKILGTKILSEEDNVILVVHQHNHHE